ncbi:hypothetical protein D3C87_1823000 [compost metagenome]
MLLGLVLDLLLGHLEVAPPLPALVGVIQQPQDEESQGRAPGDGPCGVGQQRPQLRPAGLDRRHDRHVALLDDRVAQAAHHRDLEQALEGLDHPAQRDDALHALDRVELGE